MNILPGPPPIFASSTTADPARVFINELMADLAVSSLPRFLESSLSAESGLVTIELRILFSGIYFTLLSPRSRSESEDKKNRPEFSLVS